MLFFFFQAEDGIRDYKVSGVQTCALPISGGLSAAVGMGGRDDWRPIAHRRQQKHRQGAGPKATPRGACEGAAGRLGKIPAATYYPTRKPCSTIGSGGLGAAVGMGGRDDWRPIAHRRQQKRRQGAGPKSDAPLADIRAAGRQGKNSGSDLLSHTETVQYHRLWRA